MLYIYVTQSLDGLRYTKHTVVNSVIHYVYLNVLPSGDELAMYTAVVAIFVNCFGKRHFHDYDRSRLVIISIRIKRVHTCIQGLFRTNEY